MSEKERERKARKKRKAANANPEEINLDDIDGALPEGRDAGAEGKTQIEKWEDEAIDKKMSGRGGIYTTRRINNFPSEDDLRERLTQVWEVLNMRAVVRMAVAFAVVLETVDGDKPPTHEAKPATLTDAYKWGVEVPVSTPEDNRLFVDNVFARLAAIKEKAQKDTKTKVICVYQILVAAYQVSSGITTTNNLTASKGKHGRRRQSVQDEGEAEGNSGQSNADEGPDSGDSGGPPD
jgi:hypothetical protein